MRSSLQGLALYQHLGQPDEQVQHAEVALAQRHLEGFHVKPVAGHDKRWTRRIRNSLGPVGR